MALSSIELALRAFESRPSRSEALADLARWARERGWNETAAMFARRGVSIPSATHDLLFVETWRHRDLLEDLSIAGYYSVDTETKRAAAEAAETLSLDRDVSADQRNLARNTLFWHAPKLVELAPSWQARQIEFDAPRGWRAMNPSVVRHRGKTLAIIRTVNYWIKPDGGYTFPDSEPAISTRNFLVELDSALEVARDAVEVAPDLGPVLYGGVLGLEDLRLFTWHDELRFIACARQMNEYGRVEQVTGRLGLDGVVYEMEVIRQPWVGPAEKNWMPIIGAEARFDEPHFVYRCDPMTVVNASQGAASESRLAPVAADNFSGSSQLIPFDGGWLCMTHEPLSSPINGRRLNQQRFVQFDRDLTLVALSRRFHFQLNEEIEYVVGLAQHPDGRLIVSYGSHDRQAWIGTLDADDVLKILRRVNEFGFTVRPHPTKEADEAVSGTLPEDGNRREGARPSPFDWDRIALDRKVAPEERERARRELHAHIKLISEVFPSWFARRLDIAPPEGYAAAHPSVLLQGRRIIASVRCINYAPQDRGGYQRLADGASMGGDVRPESRTLMVEIDPDTLAATTLDELTTPSLPAALPRAPALGFEDLRLFEWRGATWAIAAFAEQSPNGSSEQWLVRIGTDLKLYDHHCIWSTRAKQPEKNWMPLISSEEAKFIYLCDPTRIVDFEGDEIALHIPEIAVEHFRGGSQAIPFDGGWLAVVHWQTVIDEENRWIDFEYRNRFVWLDAEYRLKRVSPAWRFLVAQGVAKFLQNFEIVHGLCWHPDGNRLVIGYELYESEPWVGTVAVEDVRAALYAGGEMGRFDDERWVIEQTNRALQDMTAVDRAAQALAADGLPTHGGSRVKDWDTYLAIHHCRDKCAPDEPVLDVGGDRWSSFLRGMAALGYSSLTNVNIDEPRPGCENGIEYKFGDATALKLENHSVRFALCQSVIEHGVDWRAFYREMARILAPGGHLFLSTDFWEVSVGSEIFTPADIEEMVIYAGKVGLVLTGTLDARCQDAAVEWGGRRYTFINMLFRSSLTSSCSEEVAELRQSGRYPYIVRNRRLGNVTFDLWITDQVDEVWYGPKETVDPDKLWCLEHIRSGMTVVDCGSHHGQTTVAFAKAVGNDGNVIAFEALAVNVGVVEKNLSLNGCKNVSVYANALGAMDGWANFAHNGGNAQRGESGEEIHVLALDHTAARQAPRIDFVKIDVEGCELEVLHGAIDIIRCHRPSLDIEVHNALVSDPEANIDGIFALLSPYAYRYSSPGWTEGGNLKAHLLTTGAHLFCEPNEQSTIH